MSDVEQKVRAALERLFGDRGVVIAELTPEESLTDVLDWDSMDVVDLGLEFRRSLGVTLPEEADAIDTIARLVALVSR